MACPAAFAQPAQAGQAAQGTQEDRPSPPLVQVLDANDDSTISADEIAAAYAALKKLDKNGDGKLTRDEFRGKRGPQGGPGKGGPGKGGPGAKGGKAGKAGPGAKGGKAGKAGPGAKGGKAGPGAKGDKAGLGAKAAPAKRGAGKSQGGGKKQAGGKSQGGGKSPRDMPDRPRDVRFRSAMEIGTSIDVDIYDTQKQRIKLNDLFTDRYTVIVSGCLTCPAFMSAYPEIEAVYADYKDKVDFYFLYHVLAHPENRGIIQPMTIEERFMHIELAKKTLGTTVPWIAETMDNDFKAKYLSLIHI